MEAALSPEEVTQFQQLILEFYRRNRRCFPWRDTRNPYHIYLSEVMLQQTQTERVVPKYHEFIDTFPDWQALARSDLRHVLQLWSGLGYNRRARNLKLAAEIIVARFGGRLPSTEDELLSLPGVGPGTAGSLQAFAFCKPVVFIETNIRRVYLHVFFPGHEDVRDRELLPLVEATLYRESPRDWYNAVMDYGVFLKREFGNANTRSRHYVRQAPFENSNRQVRGRVISVLSSGLTASAQLLATETGFSYEQVQLALDQLWNEGFLVREDEQYRVGQ